MKFCILKLFFLLSASLVIANPSLEKSASSTSCEEALKPYIECFEIIDKIENRKIYNITNNEELCDKYNSEKCQKLARNGISDTVSECKDASFSEVILKDLGSFNGGPYTLDMFSDNMKMYIFICSKDENNKNCPFRDYYNNITQIDELSNEERTKRYIESVKETCKSKKCIDEYNVFFEEFSANMNAKKKRDLNIELKEELDGTEMEYSTAVRINEYFKNAECIAAYSKQSSDAVTVIRNNIIYVVMMVLLLYSLI